MKTAISRFPSRSLTDKVTVYIALLAALPNIPNLVYRLVQHNWAFVTFNIIAIVVGLLVAVAVLMQYRIQRMQILLSVMMAGVLYASIWFGSGDQLFWLFPGCVAFFFLLRPVVALMFSVSLLLLVFPIISNANVSTIIAFYTAMTPSVLFVFFCARELRLQHSNLSLMATEDFLTKTGNRRAFQQDAEVTMENFTRYKIPCSLILLDMDHFKKLNDTFGHTAGDKVLTYISHVISQRLRRTDRLYRLGGEEFAILLNHGGVKEALSVAQDLQKYIKSNQHEDLPNYTLSFGLAQLKRGENIEQWMRRCDKALYASKENGRDQITTAH